MAGTVRLGKYPAGIYKSCHGIVFIKMTSPHLGKYTLLTPNKKTIFPLGDTGIFTITSTFALTLELITTTPTIPTPESHPEFFI